MLDWLLLRRPRPAGVSAESPIFAHSLRHRISSVISAGNVASCYFANREESLSAQPAPLVAQKADVGFDFAGHWRLPALLILICLASLLLSFRQTIVSMVSTWQSSKTYSHCFLIVPMFSYLVWIRRKRLFAVRSNPSYWGFLCLGIVAIIWLLGDLGEAKVVQEFALVATAAAMVWSLFGSQVLKVLRVPFGFLLFAVPFGVALVPPLQDFTAWFAFHALTLSQVPAVLDHRTISLPTSVWTIAETCSGIRYLFASVVLGIFYSLLIYRSRKRQLIFLGVSMVVPIAANALRAYGIVLVGYLTNNRLAAGVDHLIYGGVFFVAVQLGMLAAGLRWRETPEVHAAIPRESATPDPGPKTQLLAAAAVAGVLGFTPFLAEQLWNRSAAEPTPEGLSVRVDPAWSPAGTYDSSWDPGLHSPDRELGQEYESGEHRVHLYWALYSGHHATELAGSAKGFGNPGIWRLASEKPGHEFLGCRSVPVDQSLLQSGLSTRSVWTLYWVGGEYTASPARVKLLQAKARLLGQSAAVVVIVMGSEDPANRLHSSEQALQDFLARVSFSISAPS